MHEPPRLLVVDDGDMNRDMLARRLVRLGYSVDTAVNGREALEKLHGSEFDLVLLDIMMPELDGYDTLAAMKADAALKHVPVVMVSAVSEIESVVKCLELGADDYLPKPFNPTILKARVTSSLDRKRLRDQERLLAQSMERELEIGREIQAGFFPDALPTAAGYQLAAHFAPARQCSGDFYDAFETEVGTIGLVVADVCDKGVGAALFMALFRSLLRAFATQTAVEAAPRARLESAVRLTNDYIAKEHGKANMFATVFFGVLQPESGILLYVNGGHEAPLVVDAGGVVRRRLEPTGPAMGMLPQVPFTVGEETLAPGELLYVFTDGVVEAKGEAGFFGEERLLPLVTAPGDSAQTVVTNVAAALAAHVGALPRYDDVTMLAVKRA